MGLNRILTFCAQFQVWPRSQKEVQALLDGIGKVLDVELVGIFLNRDSGDLNEVKFFKNEIPQNSNRQKYLDALRKKFVAASPGHQEIIQTRVLENGSMDWPTVSTIEFVAEVGLFELVPNPLNYLEG